MKTVEKQGMGFLGLDITLDCQELIAIKDLQQDILNSMRTMAERITNVPTRSEEHQELCIAFESLHEDVVSVQNFLSKITDGVKTTTQVEQELFGANENGEVPQFAWDKKEVGPTAEEIKAIDNVVDGDKCHCKSCGRTWAYISDHQTCCNYCQSVNFTVESE